MAADLESALHRLVLQVDAHRVEVEVPSAAPVPLPRGWVDLTKRQKQVARLLAAEKSDRRIATALGINLSTARSHTSTVLAKLGMRSRWELRHVLPHDTRHQENAAQP
jgi:DNA-binding CsgD family transcriptional regulator